MRTIIAIDPAFSDTKNADNSAIVVASIDDANNFYIRNYWYGKVLSDRLLDEIFKYASAYEKATFVLETVGTQKAFAQNLKNEMNQRNIRFPLIEIKNRGNKIERIRGNLQHLYASGRVFHNVRDKYTLLEEELLRFPKGRTDDIIDCAETAISQFTVSRAKQNISITERELERMKLSVPSRSFCIWSTSGKNLTGFNKKNIF